jgi:glycosyltransferase involved in cell wall biosynthesis
VAKDFQSYFDETVKPYLGEQIEYLGYIERDKLLPYYQDAKALLMPIQWEEPFGMNMIEAMACGTPVIAFRRGSIPEVVIDGKTGFIVDTFDEMVEAIKKIDTIDRNACREHVTRNFSTENMVDGYEKAFEKILKDFKPDA